MKLRDMVSASRIELLEPRPQKPSYRQLLNYAVSVVQNALNEANHTHRAWAVDDVLLQVAPGQEEYQINAANVGKVLDVTTGYDPSNEVWMERQIPFYDLTELGSWDEWGGGSAQGIAFLRKSGQGALYARVRPIPREEMEYRVSFNLGTYAEGMALDDEPFLSAHHHYLVCLIARDALPATRWTDSKEDDAAQRAELGNSLRERISEYRAQFKFAIAGLTVPRSTMRQEAFPIE